MKLNPEPKKFKCKCGSTDFKMDVDAKDLDVYGITVDTDGNIDLVELIKEYCQDSDYHNSFECYECGAEYSTFSLKPLAECEEYQAAKRMKEYVDGGGVKCPFCDSDDIEGQILKTDTGYVWQDVYCLTCGKKWMDEYNLISAKEIK